MEKEILSQEEMQIIDKCESYCYNGKKTLKPILVSTISSIFIISYVIILVVLLSTNKFELDELYLYLTLGVLIMFAYIIKTMQFDTMKVLTQYFKDENKVYYKVQFTSVSTKVLRIRRVFNSTFDR